MTEARESEQGLSPWSSVDGFPIADCPGVPYECSFLPGLVLFSDGASENRKEARFFCYELRAESHLVSIGFQARRIAENKNGIAVELQRFTLSKSPFLLKFSGVITSEFAPGQEWIDREAIPVRIRATSPTYLVRLADIQASGDVATLNFQIIGEVNTGNKGLMEFHVGAEFSLDQLRVTPPGISCFSCRDYIGKGYGHSKLHCAMHPYGPGGDCPDYRRQDFS